jgi:hypothetical protein
VKDPAEKILIGATILIGLWVFYGFHFAAHQNRGARQHKYYARAFKQGDTNTPLLAIDWTDEHWPHFCRVDRSGMAWSDRASSRREQDERLSLDQAAHQHLDELVIRLPSPARHVPDLRQVWVSGVRSNQWFSAVYDRSNPPRELEELCWLAKATLVWDVPTVSSNLFTEVVSTQEGADLSVATRASRAVSSVVPGGWLSAQLFDFSVQPGLALPCRFPYSPRGGFAWSPLCLSPDGTFVAAGKGADLFAVEVPSGKLRWVAWEGDTGNPRRELREIVLAHNGQKLFAARSNVVELWDAAQGARMAVLVTNVSGVDMLSGSWDGSTVAAAFRDKTFLIWEAATGNELFRFAESDGAKALAFSPSGEIIALSTQWPPGRFVIWNLRTKTREIIPQRSSLPNDSAFGLYWSPDGRYLIAQTGNGMLIVYDATTLKPLAQWSSQRGGLRNFGFEAKGGFLEFAGGRLRRVDLAKFGGR